MTTWPGRLRTAALLAAAAVTVSGRRHGAGAPNVLLVTVDTLRADHTSPYGYAVDTTPRLARLAARGALCETAYAVIPVTGPSHASLMTGLYPRATGVVRNGHVLDAGYATLAERLQARGYATAAVVSGFPLDRRFGLARGFEHYDDAFVAGEASLADARWDGRPLERPYDRRADAATDRALTWLDRRDRGRPFFLWVHYFDPHTPYDPPSAYRTAAGPKDDVRTLAYDGEIRFADAQLGRLLDRLRERGLFGTTLVVVTSDHGEGLGEHGVLEHGSVIYDEAMRVPLVVRYPGQIPYGRRVSATTALVDVAVTVLDLAGAGGDPGCQGRTLAPLLTGASDGDRMRTVFLQQEAGLLQEVVGLRRGPRKYIETWAHARLLRRELFDLGPDPRELRDLAPKQAPRVARMTGRIREWRTRIAAAAPRAVAPEDLEGLHALGYAQ